MQSVYFHKKTFDIIPQGVYTGRMKDCRNIISRCRRLRGQITALEERIESSDSCAEIVSLALAVDKSFDSLKRELMRNALEYEFSLAPEEQKEREKLQNILKLANS